MRRFRARAPAGAPCRAASPLTRPRVAFQNNAGYVFLAKITGSIKIQNVNIYRLQEIAQELQAESLRTGQPISISDDEARAIAEEVGLSYNGESSPF